MRIKFLSKTEEGQRREAMDKLDHYLKWVTHPALTPEQRVLAQGRIEFLRGYLERNGGKK